MKGSDASTPLTSAAIAEELGLAHVGDVHTVSRPASAGSAAPGAIVFVSVDRPELVDLVRGIPGLSIVTDVEPAEFTGSGVLVSSRPRLDFARVLSKFFAERVDRAIHPTAHVATSARLGERVSIGAHAFIDDDVTIGDDVVVGENVVVRRRCTIGPRTRIKPNTVIGEPGFGFEYDETDTPMRIPHVGAVRIGSDVEIGSLVSIARGTLDDTVIDDHVKIDDHVFIAHNVCIGRAAFVIAGAEVSGSVTIGSMAWIGPQVTIRDQVTIGERAMLGIGAVVTKDVPPGVIAIGNPARVLRARD